MQLALLMILPTRMPTVMMLSVTQAPLSSLHTQSLTTANDNTDSDLLGSGLHWIMINSLEAEALSFTNSCFNLVILAVPFSLLYPSWTNPSQWIVAFQNHLAPQLSLCHVGGTTNFSLSYPPVLPEASSCYPQTLTCCDLPRFDPSPQRKHISTERNSRTSVHPCCARPYMASAFSLRALGPSEACISVGLPKISQVMGMAELAWHWVPVLQSTTSASMRPLDSWHAAPCAPSPNREHWQQYRSMEMSSVGHTHAALAFNEATGGWADCRATPSTASQLHGHKWLHDGSKHASNFCPHWHSARERLQVWLEVYLIQMAAWKSGSL